MMRSRSWRSASAVVVAGLVMAVGFVTAPANGSTDVQARHPSRAGLWTGTWSASPQQASTPPWGADNWSEQGFDDQTVRQVVRVSTGGSLIRIRLSNAYGADPLQLTGATIAKTKDDAATRPGTVRPLTFDGRTETTVPAGEKASSDPTFLRISPHERVTVTMYFAEKTGPATFHEAAAATSYLAEGDHRYDRGGDAFDESSQSWYFLSGVDVLDVRDRVDGSVVAFGDSITDGVGSTPNAGNRYPDELSERLVDAGISMGVLNAGISGNRLLSDSPCFGESALDRFERDVLDQPGVRTVILLEGINDIGASASPDNPCFTPNRTVTAHDLIRGYRTLIRAAHEAGVEVIGGTLLPYEGAGYYTARGEKVRQTVNHWIRTSGAFDAVVDFDRALADPDDPNALNPAYDSGDHLHPNDAGTRAMAEAIELDELR